MLRPANHLAHDLCHLRLSLVGSFLNLLVTHFHWNVEAAKVGDDADAKHVDAAMTSYNDLWYGAHTHSVSTQQMVHAILGWCLEGRTLYTDIDSMFYLDAFLLGNLVGKVAELMGICFVHIRETRTGRKVLAVQWMLREEVDMVVDDHEVANLERRVHATRSVAYEEGLDAQLIHHSLWEGYFLHVVALIEMEAAFHSHDVLATQLAKYEFASMSFHCRYREVRYLTVWEFVTISYF